MQPPAPYLLFRRIIGAGAILAGASRALVPAVVASEAPPRIDRIEFFQTEQVTVHFDTEANRLYELQFRSVLASTNGPWTNLFVAPRIPFENHYIVVDWRTNRGRIYRLKVTR